MSAYSLKDIPREQGGGKCRDGLKLRSDLAARHACHRSKFCKMQVLHWKSLAVKIPLGEIGALSHDHIDRREFPRQQAAAAFKLIWSREGMPRCHCLTMSDKKVEHPKAALNSVPRLDLLNCVQPNRPSYSNPLWRVWRAVMEKNRRLIR